MYWETSKDILNLSLAVSVFGLAFILGWIMVYFLLIIRRVIKVLERLEAGISKISDVAQTVKDKIESSASYLSLAVVGIKELVQFFLDKKTAAKKKTSTKTE